MSNGTVRMPVRGRATSAAVLFSKFRAPVSSRISSLSSSPSRPDSATNPRTSSEVNAEATSSLGSTLNSQRTRWLAVSFMTQMVGRKTTTKPCSTGPSTCATRLGTAMAMFLGTISPRIMCRKVTISSAMTRAIGCSSASGTPTASMGTSIR